MAKQNYSDYENPDQVIWFNAASRKAANSRIIALRFRQLIQMAYHEKTTANFHQLRKVASSIVFDKGFKPRPNLFESKLRR